MKETIYVLYSQNMTKAFQEDELHDVVQNLIEDEFEMHIDTYSADELINEYNHLKLYQTLLRYYIRTRKTNIDINDLKHVISIFNTFYEDLSDGDMSLDTLQVPSSNKYQIIDQIENMVPYQSIKALFQSQNNKLHTD